MKAIKVCELNKYIKKYMAMDYLLNDLLVQGEVSNLKKHSNGNIYLTLKDEKSSIDGIIYSKDARNIKFDLNEGDNVEVKASASIYEKSGKLNLYIRDIKLQGLGELYEKFLYLKDSLDKEGLFSDDHKKQIPYYPKKIGLVTSPTGAAIKDFLSILKRRNNSIDVIVYPVNVQGVRAVDDILQALDYFSKNTVDVLVLTRGGGSLEDLFVFNDEELARSIYDFKTPIISAIGHEIDYVISDFVSDLRAATPSAAAELVSMNKVDLNNSLFLSYSRVNSIISNSLGKNRQRLDENYIKLNEKLLDRINYEHRKLDKINRSLNSNRPSLLKEKISLEKLILSMHQRISINLSYKKIKLENNKENLNRLSLIKNKSKDLSKTKDQIFKIDLLTTIEKKKKNIEFLKRRLDHEINNKISKRANDLLAINQNIAKLKLGYMVKLENEDGREIVSARSLDKGDKVKINFKDGLVKLTVEDVKLRS